MSHVQGLASAIQQQQSCEIVGFRQGCNLLLGRGASSSIWRWGCEGEQRIGGSTACPDLGPGGTGCPSGHLCAHELTPGQRQSKSSASKGLLLETCPAPLLSQGVWGSLRFFLYLISKKKKKS